MGVKTFAALGCFGLASLFSIICTAKDLGDDNKIQMRGPTFEDYSDLKDTCDAGFCGDDKDKILAIGPLLLVGMLCALIGLISMAALAFAKVCVGSFWIFRVVLPFAKYVNSTRHGTDTIAVLMRAQQTIYRLVLPSGAVLPAARWPSCS